MIVDEHQAYEVQSDGDTVWVNDHRGAVARFSRFGIDVHDLSEGSTACLYCTHTRPDSLDWALFVCAVWGHHGMVVDSVKHRPRWLR